MWPNFAPWAIHVGTFATDAAPWLPLLCSNNTSNPCTFCMLDHFGPLSWGRMPLQATSLHSQEVEGNFWQSFFADFLSHPTPTYIHYILASVHPSIHPSIHRSIIRSSTPPCGSLQLRFGWRVGLVHTAPMFNMFMKKRYRGTRLWPYLTLPYLTLPYLTLPYLTLPYLTLPYLTLP